MTTLQARLSQATEPTRELLEEVWETMHEASLEETLRFAILFSKRDVVRFEAMLDAEAWTSAVEMLVPDDWRWQIGRFNVDYLKCHADIAVHGEILLDGRRLGEGIKIRAQGSAKHPALALAIACLKARGL